LLPKYVIISVSQLLIFIVLRIDRQDGPAYNQYQV